MKINGFNLANLQPPELVAIEINRKACLFRYYKTRRGDWRAWVKAELEKIPEPMRQAVKDALNKGMKDGH